MMNPEGKSITPEAAIEGKAGNFYCGWGFYFARKYLAESLGPDRMDDPMKGYEESVAGTYIPPGHVSDKLMVYDLNRIFDDPSKGREVAVPDGVNFKSITLHKAGDRGNSRGFPRYAGLSGVHPRQCAQVQSSRHCSLYECDQESGDRSLPDAICGVWAGCLMELQRTQQPCTGNEGSHTAPGLGF